MDAKTAVITGASSGIGLELARLCAADGYDLVLTARRTELLRALADELTLACNVTVHILPMDLARPDAPAALWRAVTGLAPTVDILINNAGFGDASAFADEPVERIDGMLQLNIAALTALTRLALPGMLARGRGRILNVASLAGMTPGGPGMAVYFASKSYVLSFSRAIRRELRGSGVSVTALCPGPTATGFEAAAHAQDTLLFHWTRPMAAADVARAGYLGLHRGAAVVLPGWMNKLTALTARLSPAAGVIEVNRLLLQRRR
ncbi:MAG TPA: SDR family oxidoreductase [Gallionellaceae bacterium]|nr:SDR family oxidoreductase [Gallionellaceae bacterium]